MIAGKNHSFTELLCSGDIPYPLSAIIETTTRCNLRCIQCGRSMIDEPTGDMSREVFKRIEPLLKHLSEVRLFGYGETFLHPDFDYMLKRCREAGTMISITTNGTLLNPGRCRLLVESGVYEIILSIDAADPELFNQIRRGANFGSVIKNIRCLNKVKTEHKSSHPRLSFQMVGMKMNIHELPPVIRLAASLNIRVVTLLALYEYDPAKKQSLVRYPELARKYILEGQKTARDLGVDLEVADLYLDKFGLSRGAGKQQSTGEDPCTQALPQEFPRRGWRKLINLLRGNLLNAIGKAKVKPPKHSIEELKPTDITIMNCYDPWYTVSINYKGEVNPCCMSQEVMGNLAQQSFEEIWRGEKYAGFRKGILSPHPHPDCLKCSIRNWRPFYELEDWFEVGINDHFGTQLGPGWYHWQKDDGSFRWSQKQAWLRLKNTGKRKLHMVMSKSPDANLARRLSQGGNIVINEEKTFRFNLKNITADTFVFDLPVFDSDDLIIRIDCRKENIPDRYLHNGDIRRLGLGLNQAWLS